ncbi:PSI-INTERACTING ROOT-CELL ENRICHED 1 [Hibiscus trionum]|uniref:PSI-INTERACTING ROOT-CELL ENRICHED 1 n=1 Tax=Hibiscus trionum TaxID=183268 RepID=A0A9W7MU22_HIBTR|nr:PSI-INTERACTING ROOT-CELL ENRICHED 1 [Hibiscus trionum]
MEIPQKLVKFKYPIILTLALSLTLSSLIIFAPSFLTILTYFWPLFLSTALFLVAVFFFAKTSPHSGGSESPADKPGEGLLHYVAGHPELSVDSYKSE